MDKKIKPRYLKKEKINKVNVNKIQRKTKKKDKRKKYKKTQKAGFFGFGKKTYRSNCIDCIKSGSCSKPMRINNNIGNFNRKKCKKYHISWKKLKKVGLTKKNSSDKNFVDAIKYFRENPKSKITLEKFKKEGLLDNKLSPINAILKYIRIKDGNKLRKRSLGIAKLLGY